MAELSLEQQRALALARARVKAASSEEPKSYTLGEALTSAGKKGLGIGNMLSQVGQAVMHPLDTTQGLLNFGAGELSKVLPESVNTALNRADEAVMGKEKAQQLHARQEDIANAVNKDYAQYGSWEGTKRKIAEHPESVLADVSTVLGGAGALSKGTKLGKVLSTAGEYTNPLKPAEMALGGVGKVASKLENVPSNVIGSLSNVNPEAYRTVYELYKKGDPVLLDKLKNGTKLEKQLYSDMIYNYSRKLGLPHEQALTPLDYTRGIREDKLGAWDVWDKYAAEHPDLTAAEIRAKQYQPFETLSPEGQAAQAAQAGVDTGRWSLVPGGQKDVGDILKVGAKLALPTILHNPWFTALESPRIARAGFAAAGTGARLAGKAGEQLSKLPITVDQANKLALMLYQMRNPEFNQGEQ
jgi:hypothetical protein